jgi:soluble lytic murein transglycosylase-like protein
LTISDYLNKLYGSMLKSALFLFLSLLFPMAGLCAIYGYVDSDGVYHMTNIRPAHKNYYTLIEDGGSAGSGAIRNLNKNAYDEIIKVHSEANGVDPHLVKAVMIAESNANPRAISQKGAQGLMQIMPDTAQFLDLRDPFDPEENIQAGTRYLKMLNELFKGNIELVLAAYNAGPQRVMQNNMAIPPFNETISYVKRVKAYYGRLKDTQ